MVSDTSVRSNTEIVREYIDRVFKTMIWIKRQRTWLRE
jgi:hypothetical protein